MSELLTLTLPDGATRQVEAGSLPRDAVASIGHRLLRDALAVEVDGDIRRKRGVLVRGSAWVVDGAEGRSAYVRISQAQVRRYLPDRPPIEMANRMAEKGDPVVIVVAPERILSWGR